jgi:hypothetical protein
MLHPLVFAAIALIVLDRTKDSSAKETVPFGLEGSIIDCFGFLDLSVGPFTNPLRRRDHYLYSIEIQWVLRLQKKTVKLFQRNLLVTVLLSVT